MPIILRKSKLEANRPLKLNCCVTSDPQFISSLDQLLDQARSKKGLDNETLNSIELCIDKLKQIHSYCGEYDYQGIPANGFRNILICCQNILTKGISKWNPRKKGRCNQFKQILKGLLFCAPFVDEIRSKTSVNKNTIFTDDDFYKNLALQYFMADFESLHPHYDQFKASLYNLQFAQFGSVMRNLAAIFLMGSCRSISTSLLSRNRYFKTVDVNTRNIDINVLKIVDKMLPKPLFRGFFRLTHKNAINNIYIPQQTQYEVKVVTNNVNSPRPNQDVHIIQLSQGKDKKLLRHRCLVLKNRTQDQTYSGCVLLHLHGGSFVFGSPEVHLNYNVQWADRFPGGTIVIPHFKKAPKYRFPTDLNTFLDVYYWLTRSSTADQLELLGTKVEKVIVLADSSGSISAMALIMLINDIRHGLNVYDEEGNIITHPKVKLPMPTSVLLIYPCVAINRLIGPSSLLMPQHFLVVPHVVVTCTLSYLPNRTCDETLHQFCQHSKSKRKSKKGVETSENESEVHTFDSLNFVKKNPIFPNFNKERADLLFSLSNDDILNHPYISCLNYKHMHLLTDVPLVIQAIRSDIWMDVVIELLKKWPGPSSLFVMDELFHSYLPLCPLGGVYKEATDLAIDQVKGLFDKYPGLHQPSQLQGASDENCDLNSNRQL